ncbi:hypothetical protein F5Y14DRAFT_303983 [Nemania sp. NC0429]|nr:hypothetical protein F5Y14DRAFT_303983 [Nemania sp. NC0429]
MSCTVRPSDSFVDGYPALAAFIASDRDGSTTIFKRFNRLAARNLLILQSDLAELEAKLDSFDKDDGGTLETLQSLRNLEDYKRRAEVVPERMKLINDIRATIKEYREALLFESTLATIPTPDRKTLKAFKDEFFHLKPGESTGWPMLGGSSSKLYDDPDDLLVFHAPEQRDRLTMFIQDNFGYLFKDKTISRLNRSANVDYASGRKIASFIAWLSTALAAILLIGAIIILYNVESDNLKLALIAIFTILFAACVGLLTNAKRSEIFSSTAAYAAVLVVFVSGNLGT